MVSAVPALSGVVSSGVGCGSRHGGPCALVRGGPRCPAIGFPRASVGGGGCCGRRPGESRASRSCVVSCGAGGGLVGCGPSLGDAQRACGVGRGLPVA